MVVARSILAKADVDEGLLRCGAQAPFSARAGVAIKVLDGGRRAVEVALVHVLAGLGALRPCEVAALRMHGRTDVLNTRGERVGEIRPAFTLEHVGRADPTVRATHMISEH